MTILAILSSLFGAVLGHRFKVLILAPTLVIGAGVVIVIGIARAEDAWLIGLTVILVSVCLQIGYLCGTVMALLGVASRAARSRDRKFIFKKVASR